MADDGDLRAFRNVCRLFPLPGLVFFPHAILPLHIFEPRYRQMTEDALAEGDRLITMVQQRDDAPEPAVGVPAIEEIACLGRIIQHQRLPDGRFNILLLGLKRVRLTREIPTEKLYRLAEAETLEDRDLGPAEGDHRRNDLHHLFGEVVSRTGPKPNDADLLAILETSLPLGPLTDLVAYTLGLPVEVKQRLLAEARVAHRADALMEILGRILAHHPGETQGASFPPPFSSN
ncbi:LON peptidase substrate-binding domain-containing protein [Singulisphaera acidiphila]|uniref:Peptidase S16, lon domain protein n=1 Tax=Singulisphaera acidiphila (strain ATCC BAA-1392 / DSM 18658 / VKM B-2454 / MOB10) TaxID=886293 RepID=L0DF19_SINAD|nr:LON peptidase substrate-binding domain-containing protein [Singulisphaera acidiphila]AGA27276.1 peptidase S16, lon domain protein [Singulisphaera acidiphila DSM 18658]